MGDGEVVYLPGAPRPGLTCLWLSRRHRPLSVQIDELAGLGVSALVEVVRVFANFGEILRLIDTFRPHMVVAVVRSDWVLRLAKRRDVRVFVPVFETVYRGSEPPYAWDKDRDWVERVRKVRWKGKRRVAEDVYYVRRFVRFVELPKRGR